MVLNAAVQMLREADELKETISKFKSGTSMLQERSLWATQQQLQKIYQKVLVLDLDYALDKKVEQDLWNIGFKQQIEALQSISKDKKNPLRSEGQAMLSWVLQAAAGFYLCLLHQICTTFQLDLPFRRRASLLGWVEGWGAGCAGGGARLAAAAAARYICQHCLVHLGDLARYRQQLRVAHTFYRHALVVSVHSGQPYNQLALVAWRRARRLAALYWHVRSLLVRAPFPPAPPNLASTLRAAARPMTENKDLPVLPGMPRSPAGAPGAPPAPQRLDAHSYITELIRALHFIHSGDELDTAETLVNSLNSSLSTLIATDSFESMTLIKMTCVLIWIVHSATEELTVEAGTTTEGEARAAALSLELAAGALLALLLPNYTALAPRDRSLPAVKVWLEWCVAHPRAPAAAAWRARPALYHALAHTLNAGAAGAERREAYATMPLPEDEELHGFLPLEGYLSKLRFPNHAAWDTYGARVPAVDPDEAECESPVEVPTCLLEEPELQKRVRAHRLVQLGKRLAEIIPEQFSFTEEDDKITFTAASAGGDQLSVALAELSAAGGGGEGGGGGGGGGGAGGGGEDEDGDDSDDDAPALKPPVVISEADFREKVREKRAGILKPQGSLERAREERAMLTQDEQDEGSEDGSKGEDKKELRKPRVNIAMAAIMRKQEETNKQVKFVTPPPTPESTADSTESKEEKPKMIQPKAIKSLANLPLGRKTGGILSLKDKSGYPHLVNVEPEPKKEKEEKKEPKLSQANGQSQTYQPKRQELPPSPPWAAAAPPAAFSEPRMNFQKNYGVQSVGPGYQPVATGHQLGATGHQLGATGHQLGATGHQPGATGQGIRLPVVNPKEIDVRTAALQKQSSRHDLFQDGHKFNHNYQSSGDKKNFLNDLPPRFANQYRYWQAAQETQFDDNKFRDDSFTPAPNFNQQPPRSNWTQPPVPETYRPNPWWNPDNPSPNFNYSGPATQMKPNYFAPMNASVPNPYQNVPSFNPMQNNMVQNQPENSNQSYSASTIGQPMQTLQSLVTSPNFNSSLNSYGSYPAAAAYDAAMYPQFNNNVGFRALQMQKPTTYQEKDMMDVGIGFGNVDMQRNLSFNEPKSDVDGKKLEQHKIDVSNGDTTGNTYSLFSGAPNTASWGSVQHRPPQSLWSGPGPSPLERLLEQQKQMSQPPAPQ